MTGPFPFGEERLQVDLQPVMPTSGGGGRGAGLHIKSVRLQGFKRFTDLEIAELPPARLIMLAGPNGSGKSSLFDGFRLWIANRARGDMSWEPTYHQKAGSEVPASWPNSMDIQFHEELPGDRASLRNLIYIRSAYRNEASFETSGINRQGPIVDVPQVPRLIENDVTVGGNYQRLVSQAIDGVFGGEDDSCTVEELRERFVGTIRRSMRNVFGDLTLASLGDPMQDGTFFFDKGDAEGFRYKNLSGGEKAAFDLLLDLIIKRTGYDNSVFCIDEPELHMNTRIQGALLTEMFSLIPPQSQLWIASHSIGMMRAARDIAKEHPGEVLFLDFEGHNFDDHVVLSPVKVDRGFWARVLDVALGDLGSLVAPTRVVLCEGRPRSGESSRAEFDARCYRRIFGEEFPDTDFMSVGNYQDVAKDRLQVGQTIQAVASGTEILRLIDRDDRTAAEIASLEAEGVRVLSKRNIESYLLDGEIISAFCASVGQGGKTQEVLDVKAELLDTSRKAGKAPDDYKSIAGELYVKIKAILGLTQFGSTKDAFMEENLASLIRPGSDTYEALKRDIFG